MFEVKDIHDPFKAWLNKQGIPFHYSRSDKATTGAVGDPDFLLCLDGKCLYLEAKLPGKKLAPVQQKRVAYLLGTGNTVKVCYSLEECISAAQTWLAQEKASGGHSERHYGQFGELSKRACQAPFTWPGDLNRHLCEDLRGVGGSRPESEGLAPERIATSQQQVAGGRSDPSSQNLFILNILGNDWLCRGDRSHGGTAERVRRANAEDLRDYR